MQVNRTINKITLELEQPWLNYGLLILITIFAGVLRFHKLGVWSFWIDEIYTVNSATTHFSTLQLIFDNLPPNGNWIPLSLILSAQSLNIWGENEFNARLISVIIGVLTLPLLYFPTRKMFNSRVALITMLLLSVSPWHLEWSQNARFYTSLLLFYSLALFTVYYGFEKNRISYFLVFFVYLYLASSERLIALFILPILVLYLCVVRFLPYDKPSGLKAWNIFILLSPGLLIIAYEIYASILNRTSIIGPIINEIVKSFFGKPIESPLTQMIFLVFSIGIPLFTMGVFSGLYLLLNKTRQGLFITLSAFVPFFLVVFLTAFMFTEERYAFITLLGWVILAAVGVDALLAVTSKIHTFLAIGLLAILLADAMGANLVYFHTNNGNRRDWRGAFSLVKDNMQPKDIVVSTWSELGSYYLQQDVLLWQDVSLETIIQNRNRYWFVVIPDMAWVTGTEDFYWWVSHNTRLIKTLYLRTVDNSNLEIYLYDPAIDSVLLKLK